MEKSKKNKLSFSSKLGGMLAVAGSAVGLGNIWRFPTEAGSNGGSAFILVYLAVVFIFGIQPLENNRTCFSHNRLCNILLLQCGGGMGTILFLGVLNRRIQRRRKSGTGGITVSIRYRHLR